MLAVGLRAQRRRAAAGLPVSRWTGRRDHGWRALILHVLTDALAGDLLLAAVVVLYYYGVARVASNFLDSEFTGSAALLGISLPLFLALSWVTERRRRARPPSGGRETAESAGPREPAGPGQPGESAGPGQPGESAGPGQPGESAGPGQPDADSPHPEPER